MITDHWDHILEQFKVEEKDIYFTEPYVRLYENDLDKAECFHFQKDNRHYLFPYLKRRNSLFGESFYDFETQYGYAGPVSNSDDTDFLKEAEDAFVDYCKSNNFLCGFIRFHPLLNNDRLMSDRTVTKILDRSTVAIDTTLSDEEIWAKEIHTKHRNVIRKAMKSDLEYYVDRNLDHVDDFLRLYWSTMEKLNADEYYKFSDNYFSEFFKLENVFLAVVKSAGKVIAASSFMLLGDKGHYHLSGSDPDFLRLYPNNLMLYETALYMKQLGVKRFHLGGGTTSDENDSLFKFKKRFSKSTLPFKIGKLILDKEKYGQIEHQWIEQNPDKAEKYKNFLLKYRY